jgi:hypothetical protein
MSTKLAWIIPAGLGMGVALVLAWQQLARRPLQAELEVLRDRQSEVRGLKAEQARLQAQQVSDAELERLRADRVALERLRREMAGLETRAEQRSQQARSAAAPAERFAIGQAVPASAWRNAGAASPAAALETVLWAAAGGEVDQFAQRIQFEPAAEAAAKALLESLPPAERARHASPAHLLAYLSVKDIPIGTAKVVSWPSTGGKAQGVSLMLGETNEKARVVRLVFQQEGAEWKLRATEAAVAKYATALRGAPAAAGAK